jgi:hypothetical protein
MRSKVRSIIRAGLHTYVAHVSAVLQSANILVYWLVACHVIQVFPEDARLMQLARPVVSAQNPGPHPFSSVTVESPIKRIDGAAITLATRTKSKITVEQEAVKRDMLPVMSATSRSARKNINYTGTPRKVMGLDLFIVAVREVSEPCVNNEVD